MTISLFWWCTYVCVCVCLLNCCLSADELKRSRTSKDCGQSIWIVHWRYTWTFRLRMSTVHFMVHIYIVCFNKIEFELRQRDYEWFLFNNDYRVGNVIVRRSKKYSSCLHLKHVDKRHIMFSCLFTFRFVSFRFRSTAHVSHIAHIRT
jgi:hypothetical protein